MRLLGREEDMMATYRGYALRSDGTSVKIETLHGTVISEAPSEEKAEKIIDDWMNAP